jgi:hypothetical protein
MAMSSAPAVIIKRGGFFSTVAQGLFGSIMVLLICGTVLGLYGMHLWDRHALTITRELAGALPEWRRVLPPVIVDALNDRRAIEYREMLSVSARVATVGRDDDQAAVVVEVTNKGPETVSLLALRVVLENGQQVPLHELSLLAATPVALWDREWRGPLQPGAARIIAERVSGVRGELKPVLEIVDVRVWSGPLPDPGSAAPPAGGAPPTPAALSPAAPDDKRPMRAN